MELVVIAILCGIIVVLCGFFIFISKSLKDDLQKKEELLLKYQENMQKVFFPPNVDMDKKPETFSMTDEEETRILQAREQKKAEDETRRELDSFGR